MGAAEPDAGQPYVPEPVESILARSDVAVIATINAVLYSGGVPLPPPAGPDGAPPAPGTLLPRQPDQIIGLTVLNVLAGSLPDGPLTVYKVNERFWIGDAEIGQKWLFFLSRQNSGRWRTVVSFTAGAVDEVRAELEALNPPPAPSLLPARAPAASSPAQSPPPGRAPRAAASGATRREPTSAQEPARAQGLLGGLRRRFGLD